MFNSLERISVWEIAHRICDIDPDTTESDQLPVHVKDAIRSLTYGIIHDAYEVLKVFSHNGVENKGVTNPKTDKRYSYDQVQELIYDTYKKSSFDKEFLESIFFEKDYFGLWCKLNHHKLPPFWFPENWKPDAYIFSRYPQISIEMNDDKVHIRPVQIDKQLCQAIAKTLWDIDQTINIADMTKHPSIQIYGNGKLYKGQHTLRDWLSEVAPEEIKGKRGRPKKPESL